MSDPLRGREEGLFTLTLKERHWMRILVTLNAARQDADKNANGSGTVRYLTGQALKAHELSQVAELITDRLGGVEDKAPAGWDCIPGDRDRD